MEAIEIIKKVIFGIISLLGFILMTISIILIIIIPFETRIDYTIVTLLMILIIVGLIFGLGSLIMIVLTEKKKKIDTIIKLETKNFESPKLIKFQRNQIKKPSFTNIWPIILFSIPLIAITWISNEIMNTGDINFAYGILFMGYSLIIPIMIIFGINVIITYFKNRKIFQNHDHYFSEKPKNNDFSPQYKKKNENNRYGLIKYTDDFYCGKCGSSINSKMFRKSKNNVIEPNGQNYYLCKKCDKKRLIRVILVSFIILGLLMGMIVILIITLQIEGLNIYYGIYFSTILFLSILFPNIWTLCFIPTILNFYFKHKNRYE